MHSYANLRISLLNDVIKHSNNGSLAWNQFGINDEIVIIYIFVNKTACNNIKGTLKFQFIFLIPISCIKNGFHQWRYFCNEKYFNNFQNCLLIQCLWQRSLLFLLIERSAKSAHCYYRSETIAIPSSFSLPKNCVEAVWRLHNLKCVK